MLLGILTLWLIFGQNLWAQTTSKYSIDIYADSYAGGDGSKTNPYKIATAEQLAKLARDVNNGNTSQAFLGKYFMLTQDIDLSGGIWMPIGKYYNYGNPNDNNRLFFGKFDGNGHVIRNMHIQWEGLDRWSAWGLFSTLQGASSTNLTTVTNLIIENAVVEKKPGFSPTGPGYNVGVVAGEVYNNTELSNIIIRGSEIKDNDETYEINRETKIGGIAGNLQTDSKNETFRIFNIAADTKINMLKNTKVFSNKFYIAQGFGRFSYDMNGGGNIIEPTNIYLFGNGLNIDNTSTYINKGGITANCQKESNANKYASTWYYTQDVTGGKNLGTKKADASFMNEFVDKANEFIYKNPLVENKYTWNFSDGKFTLNKQIEITIAENTYNRNDQQVSYTLTSNQLKDEFTYTWTVDGEAITPNAGSNDRTITLPLSNRKRKVLVIIKDGNTNTVIQKKYFDINPKYYSIDLYADNYEGGTGTKEDPFIISNDLQLAKLARDVENWQMQDCKYFKLAKNISLDKALWMPIGNTKYNWAFFKGKFDGDGHTIDKMHICWKDNSGSWSAWGLFSALQSKGNNESETCMVTNLIIDHAVVEKEEGYMPVGNGLNIGILAGELFDGNIEISNIIIRNSKMTDNKETYSTPEIAVGGIIGKAQDGKIYRIFNLASDVDINMFDHASQRSSAYLAGGIGSYGWVNTSDSRVILPTNIYVQGKVSTADKDNRCKVGEVIGNRIIDTGSGQAATWYYVNQASGPENNVMTNGTQKNVDDFATTFASQNNLYLSANNMEDKLNWSYKAGTGLSFGTTYLTVKRGSPTLITAETTPNNAANEKYFWYTSTDKKNWTLQNENNPYNDFSISLTDFDQYVYAILEDGSSQSGIVKIDARRVDAVMKTQEDSKTLYIDITNNIWENNDKLTVTYSWMKNDVEVSQAPTFDKSSLKATDKLSCHVTVTTQDGEETVELLNVWLFYAKSVVYLCPAGVTVTTANGSKWYNAGNDSNDGSTPETAVKTWKGAYSKLDKEGSWDDNTIVLMGKSDQSVTNDGKTGFTYINDYNSSSEKWENAKATSPFFKNTTITGSWNGVDYQGVIEMYGGHELYRSIALFGDTRFQHLTFNRNPNNNDNDYYDILYCQFNNLEMGEGIQMTNYNRMYLGDGTIKGAFSTSFQIFGGFKDDKRFAPLSTEGNLQKMDDALPHGREGFKIKIKSGHFSTICVGGRQTVDQRNGVMGSPNMPIKCTIDVDIDRSFNDAHNENSSTLDIAAILAGNHEGAMVGDVDIIIKSGKIGRVVNGSLGARRNTSNYNAPYNTYMGRANILIDPAQSENNNKNTDVNSRVEITEIYGGSTGRGFAGGQLVENPFYGYSTINIKGGTFKIPSECKPEEIFSGIYGAGAGGMNGIGDDTNHTTDDRIPYWTNSSTKSVMAFGNYNTAKNNLCMYKCYNADTHTYTEIDPRLTHNQVIIEGGIFGSETRKIDGIYGGGSGYMSQDLWRENAIPSKVGGNIYGKAGETAASLIINGGEFYCSKGIFAGGRGTDYFYSTDKKGGNAADYTDLGKIYGNVELTINGGTFHCPVFGGGYGVADAKLKDNNTINTLDKMARIYGKSTVKINGGTFFENIYGGGDMAVVEQGTNVAISDKADIRGDVFAGGNGRKKRLDSNTTIADDTWHPELVGKVLGGTNLNFYGTTAQAPSIYGDIYGGGNRAQVEGDTHINIYAANFAGEIYGGGKGLITDSNDNLLDANLYTYADVTGNTFVKLAQDQGAQTEGEDGKKQDNFSINVIWDKKWNGTDLITWKDNKSLFFNDGQFICPHNIYGGGNQACNVTGKATLTILKGMTPFGLLKTAEWKAAYDDSDHPHFAVFGGGYGINTTVGSTDVTVNVDGDYGVYNAEIEDDTEQLAKPHRSSSKSKNRRNAASSNQEEISVFDNSKGIPNFTILSALGGGYAGIVNTNTKVTIDGKTFLHRVYGGGFGDPFSTGNNETGEIGGNTEVHIQGANIYGDVFGGGAGVAPKNINGTYTYFTNVAKVSGTTKVEISGEAKIYGNVYGGGDIANIKSYITLTGADKEAYYNTKPKSESKLDQTTGKFLSYEAKDYTTFVNITGGDIFGEVFGGGKGLKKAEAPDYQKVGRINGNTLVHVVNTDATSLADTDSQGNIVPFIWSNIYGGCAFGTVDGNTLVHIEGGKLGHNIYGGGYGNIKVDLTGNETEEEKEDITRNTVLGKKDANKEGTYANILGNTKVQIDGGTWIWNRKADINGNITTWLAVQNNEKVCENIDEFKEMTAAILKAKTVNEITNEKAKAAIERIISDENTRQFYAFTKGTMNSGSFKLDHNIYGGGNRACYVGFGLDGNSTIGNGTSASNGLSEVIINHSPLADVITKDGNLISVFDETSLAGLCWYISSKNTNDPQFSIFGAGFGANTKVAKTEVCVQPGTKMDDDGAITVNGIKYRYLNQNADYKTYVDFEKQIYNDFLKVSRDDKKLYFGSVTGSNPGDADFDPMTFKRYHASRWAWTLGLPGYTFQAIHGGGFSGYVTGETYVETDCQPFCENIFGAGVGAMPIGSITANQGDSYDFGKVGTRSRVFIKSGYVAQNVYGGGAGIESVYDKNQNTWIDFPNMARVPKTVVHLYGRSIKYKYNLGLIDRTMILGSVYGGGDVANVGYEEAKEDPDVFTYEHHQVPARYTSLVNIRGGVVFSQVFAGGRGRLKSECKDYTKLGGIYGNTSLVIDRPNITYPYFDEETKEYIKPWSENAMKHPDNDTNKDIIPTFLERIYGGCENGTVYGNTFMSITDGQIGHGIYGGGWGNCDSLTVNGTETINVTSANVTGNTNVLINGGQALLSSYWNPETRSWRPASIIDGITYSPQYDHEALKFKVNHNIYAGGNEACVVGNNTNIVIAKGFLNDNTEVKPGQDKKNMKFYQTSEWKEIYNKVGSPHFSIFGGGFGEKTNVVGNTNITIDMQGRDTNNHQDIELKPGKEHEHFCSDYSYMDIVGGGYSGTVEGSTNISGAGGAFCRRVFGGGFYSSVKETNVTIKAIDCRDIFGGGFMGDVKEATHVIIGSDTNTTSGGTTGSPSGISHFNNSDIHIHGNVYGGNDVSGYVNITAEEDGFRDNGGDGSNIQILGGNIYQNVYGAGNGNYLYALDKNQNQKVTVNEYYPMNPEDPNSETVPLVYTVPMRESMPSYKGASDAAKIVNINSWRPLTNKVNIEIKGNSTSEKVNIAGDVYGGGNSATVLKVKGKDSKTVEKVGNIQINIGSHVNIGRVFMGCNGDELFAKSENNDFMNKFQKLNGNVEDYTQELNLADTIDWFYNPSNKDISTLYLPTKLEDRPTVYPHLIDLYFQPVETDIQGNLQWNGSTTGEGLEDCTIKTFCCGGNRGNMNIYPDANGNVINYIFPAGLTITDKIVGGCNNANYNYKGLVNHEGGYLLGRAHSTDPFIKLTIKNQFQPEEKNDAYVGGNVFGGCYQTGTVRGDITILLQSNMLKDKSEEKLDNSNKLLATQPEYSTLNVFGAGYGMESYVYGNTDIRVAEGIKSDVSANFIYGGGQQGNVIGVTNVEIFNGHIYKAVTGGSYSGYVWGSTQVRVGYPTYYQVRDGHSGIYLLDRTDKNNLYIDHVNKDKDGKMLPNLASETIKQSIRLIGGDKVSQAVYASIIGKQGTTNFVKENDFNAFTTAPASPLTWNDINIKIGEAIYGGGYSVAQGTSVMANDSTVLKYTRQYNIDKAFTERQDELAELPNGTTTGFGGNTTILVADNSAADSNRDHIIISHQKMKPVVLPEGTDLFGYYYMHEDGNYRYISLQDSYFYGAGYKKPEHQLETDKNIYAYDSEGGIFGDGHQSYAAGFRSADLTGYGFAGTNINNPKIINTFQRLDILRLEDNCFNVLGARDYATNRTNKTPYSIARVGEIQMFAKNIALTDNTLQNKSTLRARNYMGLANNIHYVGAVTSNVPFNDAVNEPWRNDTGMIPADGDFKGKSYMEVKQDYIDKYDQKTIFQKRNDGTAKNMIGIASGYALKIQNAQELYDESRQNVIDKIFYGPIYGVVEMNLIDVREDEGGGYVYADNVHKRAAAEGETGHKVDFLETTGNFVFPYDAKQNRFIVDDCFPTGFYGMDDAGKANPDDKVDVHYWYVTGFNYYYNAHITGYTYKDKMTFYSDNQDGLTVLAGLKPNQPVTIQSWKMRSGHPTDKNEYSCDLEKRNYLPTGTNGNVDMDNQDVSGKYQLNIGASSSKEYDGNGFDAVLPMNGVFEDKNYQSRQLPSKLTDGDAKISFRLTDQVNNTTTDYFKKHLSEKCLATVVLKGRAYEEYTDETNNKPIISKVASSDFFTQEGNDFKQVATGTKLSAGTDYYIKNAIAGEYTKIYPERIYKKGTGATEGYTPVNINDVVAGENYYCEVERIYTYTIYLTIEYVQGPNINGKITVDNCALPGEMVRLRKNQISIEADESFSANGYYWRIGKRKQNEKGNWVFEDATEWDITQKAKGYDTYKQGSSEAQGLFKDCVYDKTNDYLDIPAYYFMNGYGVQLGITMNGLNKIFTVDMKDDSQFTVHNYHRMNPHQKGVNLHLSEAIQRSQEDKTFAEPRIYISDASDLKAFINFVDTIGTGTGSKAARYGKNAQFVLQNDITVTSDFDGSKAVFAGILHGNGHVIKGLAQGKSFLKENRGNIYNLGMESGNIAESNTGAYHCCFEYNKGIQPIVYHMDGKPDTHYKADDFRYGKVAYDLNEYYLRARYSNNMENAEDKEALKYVYDYYANGDYQYAHRTDAITGNNTGITYLRKGSDSDLPNYGSNETRHDQSHTIDAARKASQGTASAVSYIPLFNGNQADGSQPMNDFIFWGQSLQKVPALYPSQIASHENSYMRNRIYRTAGYYGDTKLDAFHYNASNNANSLMSTYVHQTATTAIDFTCLNDKGAAMGFNQAADINKNGIFYTPVDDNAKIFSDLSIQQGVSQNLLVYTAANGNDIDNNTEAYDIADNALGYKENTSETTIYGHHIFKNNAGDGYTTSLLHLVERTPEGKNSEGDKCENNDFCAPIPFTVTNHAWYVRKPMYYAEDATGAWEGICLPFTAQKVKASLNGEITHFYGDKYLHHEYWLRGLTEVNTTDYTATFQRPGTTAGLFQAEEAESKDYTFNNDFFVTTYGEHFYNKDANPYYSNPQEYKNYQLLTKGIPYLVRFPGNRYYEFDLSSKFYNNILNANESSQTVTFHAFGNENETEPADKAIVIPITQAMATQQNGYYHVGSFAATKVANGTIYGMNAVGSAFDDASTLHTVMPFRTYMTTLMTNARTRSTDAPSVIRIAEATGIEKIESDVNGNGEEAATGDYLTVHPINNSRVRIESTYATQLQVFSTTGQLYRLLDIQPGTATYSGFHPGIYIFGKKKVMVK